MTRDEFESTLILLGYPSNLEVRPFGANKYRIPLPVLGTRNYTWITLYPNMVYMGDNGVEFLHTQEGETPDNDMSYDRAWDFLQLVLEKTNDQR